MLRYKRTRDKGMTKPVDKPMEKPVEKPAEMPMPKDKTKPKAKDASRFKDPKFLAVNNAKIWSAIYAISKKNK